jgi:hypothetical protein
LLTGVGWVDVRPDWSGVTLVDGVGCGGGPQLTRAPQPTRAPVFDGVSICPIFGISRPRTRRLHVLRTRAIVQPSGSTCPSRLHAWNSPCVCIRRLGAEILPMESRRTSSNGAGQSQIKSVAACQFQHLNQIEMLRRSNEAIGGIGVEVGGTRRYGQGGKTRIASTRKSSSA